MEAIILAGGKGTRLHSITNDLVPKPLVKVADKPFLFYLIDRLFLEGVSHIVIAVGHLGTQVIEQVSEAYPNAPIEFSIEENLLGTGGAIQLASRKVQAETFVVLNGDTFVDVSINKLVEQHSKLESELTMTAVKVDNVSRYGAVDFQDNLTVSAFKEKGVNEAGYINAGVYVVEKATLNQWVNEMPCSFEETVLMQNSIDKRVFPHNGYFIDIGVPDDYERAQSEFRNI